MNPAIVIVRSPIYPALYRRSLAPYERQNGFGRRRYQEPQQPRNSMTPQAYQGNQCHAAQSTRGVPPQGNCALTIRGLPASCTIGELLVGISGVGKVFASYILPPNKVHPTPAAQIIMWDSEGAKRLFDYVEQRLLWVCGHCPYIMTNRRFHPSQPKSHHTRVIEIGAPHGIMREAYLRTFFNACGFAYELTAAVTVFQNTWQTHIILYFASYWGQAERAYAFINMARKGGDIPGVNLSASERDQWEKSMIFFQRDPCDELVII
ncbi:hypothetical protein F4778DRAFT_783775 [Xylariomycetidae sp. FL2044]|nr:hypothetical protein F4778DRAFT_783775 [Xylariomycetidae sp. FL2044]